MLSKRKIADIKCASFNPKTRHTNIADLVSSIERVGLLQPLLITKDGRLCDGHRRLEACKQLGWTEVPVIVVTGEQAEIFREINFSNRRLSGNEALHAWLAEPQSVSKTTASGCEECERTIGRQLLKRMANENYSLGIWRTLKNVAREADQETPDVLTTLIKWAMKHHCIANVRKALGQGMSPGQIVVAAMKDKTIRIKHAISE